MTSPHFPLPVVGEWLGPCKFKLHALFVYDDPEMDIRVDVPAGFVTDFNSTPRAVWWYFAPIDVLEAGVVHDWLYAHPERFVSLSLRPPLTRDQVDGVHRRILHLKGMRWTKRQVIHGFLRAGGGVAWNRHRRKDGELSKILNN